jgi:RNA polymerase sigma factor (sigma-70 family)
MTSDTPAFQVHQARQFLRGAPQPFAPRFTALSPAWRLFDECIELPQQEWRAPTKKTTTTKPAPPEADLQAHLAMHYAQLHRRLERQLGCADLASECLHDAWLRLGERQPREVPANPEAYIYRVACNLAMDSLRERKRWSGLSEERADVDVIADLQPGPDLIAEARSEVAAVDRAMQRLPRRHRAVLLALRWHEMSRQEVARRHGVSLRKVDTALRQALGVLR